MKMYLYIIFRMSLQMIKHILYKSEQELEYELDDRFG